MATASSSFQSTYDTLYIVRRLEQALAGVATSEIQVLAYLSCLLSLYGGRSVSEWDYSFVRSEWGAPHSADLSAALASLRRRGMIADLGLRLSITPDGVAFASFLSERGQHAWRGPFLEGACSSVLAMPVGLVRAALHYEPSLRQASTHAQARRLLGDADVDSLHLQFEALNTAIGPASGDLMLPSVVWLTYLVEMQERSMLAGAGSGA